MRPFGILGQMWVRIAEDLALAWPRLLGRGSSGTTVGDLLDWQLAWTRSLLSDPLWHARWSADVQRQVGALARGGALGADPRFAGVV